MSSITWHEYRVWTWEPETGERAQNIFLPSNQSKWENNMCLIVWFWGKRRKGWHQKKVGPTLSGLCHESLTNSPSMDPSSLYSTEFPFYFLFFKKFSFCLFIYSPISFCFYFLQLGFPLYQFWLFLSLTRPSQSWDSCTLIYRKLQNSINFIFIVKSLILKYQSTEKSKKTNPTPFTHLAYDRDDNKTSKK